MKSPDSPQDDTWQLGQYIPQSEPSESPPDFYSLIVQMKTSITSEIQKVQSSIDTLSDRVDKLEKDFTSTANTSHLNQTPSSTSSSSDLS